MRATIIACSWKSLWTTNLILLALAENTLPRWAVSALNLSSDRSTTTTPVDFPRRQYLLAGLLATGVASSQPAAADSSSLAARLAQRDASVLPNRVFNLPPASAQVYPTWMRGDWRVTSQFSGFLFPSRSIAKERLIQNSAIAGFQKCSIATTADVGVASVQYDWRIDPTTGFEDRSFNLQHQIDAYLGYPAVQTVYYDAKRNPNRLSVDFVDYRTVNAERIELFGNARESEQYTINDVNGSARNCFSCAEYLRQVTFGTGSTVGVPRQVVTNYAHFATYSAAINDDDATSTSFTGNLLTAAYLDPQDPMYFEEPSKPVAVYSHVLSATRIE